MSDVEMCQSHSRKCLSWLGISDWPMSGEITFTVLVKHKRGRSSLSLVNITCQDSLVRDHKDVGFQNVSGQN